MQLSIQMIQGLSLCDENGKEVFHVCPDAGGVLTLDRGGISSQFNIVPSRRTTVGFMAYDLTDAERRQRPFYILDTKE